MWRLLLLWAVLHAQFAYGLFDSQFLVGKRWYQISGRIKDVNATAEEMNLSVHFDPFPLVPVAFGLNYMEETFHVADFGSLYDSAKGDELSVEAHAWLSLPLLPAPYLRFRYIALGHFQLKGRQADQNLRTIWKARKSGFHIGVGARFGLIPLVKLLGEVSFSFGKLESRSLSVDGVKTENGDPILGRSPTFESKSILVGVQVGI